VGNEAGLKDGVQVSALGAALLFQAMVAGPVGGRQGRLLASAFGIWHGFPSCAAEFVVIIVTGR
jgi:hypothetical protein